MLTSKQEHILSHNSQSHWSHSDRHYDVLLQDNPEPNDVSAHQLSIPTHRQQSQEEGTLTEQHKTINGVLKRCLFNTLPQILPVLGLYLSHLTEGLFSLNQLTFPLSDINRYCHPRLSTSPRCSTKRRLWPFRHKLYQKCAHPHIRNDARDVVSQGRPENFHNSSLKT